MVSSNGFWRLREVTVGFSIGNKGLYGTGFINDDFSTCENDFWEYTPDSTCATGINEIGTKNFPIAISPNPFTTTTLQIPAELLKENCSINIFDAKGKKVFQSAITKTNFEISRKGWADGIYFYKIISKEKIIGGGKLPVE